jgi:hypothetical protein
MSESLISRAGMISSTHTPPLFEREAPFQRAWVPTGSGTKDCAGTGQQKFTGTGLQHILTAGPSTDVSPGFKGLKRCISQHDHVTTQKAVQITRHASKVLCVCTRYLHICLWLCSPTVGLWPLFQFLILYTVGRTPWTGDQPVTRPLPTHRINAHGYQCLECDSNPRSQCSSLRPRGPCDRHFKLSTLYSCNAPQSSRK